MNFSPETFSQVCAVIASELGCAAPDLTPETTAEDVNGWDSLAHARLILALEEHLSIQFPGDKLFDLDCVGDLVTLADQALRRPRETSHDVA